MNTTHYLTSNPENEPRNEVSIFEKENPYSILNMVPEWFQKRLFNANQELLGEDESHIREKCRPTPLVNRIRMAFWVEYDTACRMGRKIDMARVYGGLCTRDNFLKTVCRPNNMAWVLTPVSSYKVSMEEALEHSIAQMRKMLDCPLYKADGQLDTQAANVVLRVFTLLDQRVHGSIVQKVETKSLSVQKHIHQKVEPGPGGQAPQIDIDEKLKALETQVIQNHQLVLGVPSGETEES